MFKHKCDKNIILDGKTYKPVMGIVELPVVMEKHNPIEDENKPDYKQLAMDAGLKGEELKKFMKMNATNKQLKLDKLEGKL